MTALPEAVEQAIKEVVFAAHDTGLFASDKYVRFEGEQVAALRAAILSYGAARERETLIAVAEAMGWTGEHKPFKDMATMRRYIDERRKVFSEELAARERQGIERAREHLLTIVDEYTAMAEASAFREPSDEYRIKSNALGIAYVRLCALPVEGETK